MMFEVGEEYYLAYGTAEEQSFESIKVLEVNGSWLKVEAKNLDPLINTAAPYFISARKRDREIEAKFTTAPPAGA